MKKEQKSNKYKKIWYQGELVFNKDKKNVRKTVVLTQQPLSKTQINITQQVRLYKMRII